MYLSIYPTYDDHLRLIWKRVVDFLLVLIELFSLGVAAEALRANIGSKSAISLQWGPADSKFPVEGAAPTNHSSSQKTRLNDLSYGIKIWTDLSSLLSQCTRLTGRQTDGRKAFSSLYRVCIICSAVKSRPVAEFMRESIVFCSTCTMSSFTFSISSAYELFCWLSLMMLLVSASHFSTVRCLMLHHKRKLKFLTKVQHSENKICEVFENILLTNWISCTNICLVKLFKFFFLLYCFPDLPYTGE